LTNAALICWGEVTGVAPLEHPRENYAIPGKLSHQLATLVRGNPRRSTVMRFRPANLRVTCRRLRRAGHLVSAESPP
jgi:hypothetical protein